MKTTMTTDLLKESIQKEDRKRALKVLKETMSGVRFNDGKGEEDFFFWLDEEEIPLILDAMITFANQKTK